MTRYGLVILLTTNQEKVGFDREIAEQFGVENRIILAPGETLLIE